jgi:outer membrane protein assembly factor BamA
MLVSGRGPAVLALVIALGPSAFAETTDPGTKTDVVDSKQSPAASQAQVQAEAAPPASTALTEDKVEASQASTLDSAQNLVSAEEKKGPLREFRIFPAPFFSPETSLGVAVVTAYFYRFKDYPKARTSANTSLLGATFNRQFSITNQGNVNLGNNEWILNYFVQGRLWPNGFFGIGPDVGTTAESYEHRSINTSMKLQKRFFENLYIGPNIGIQYHQLTNLQEGGQLIQGSVPGSNIHMVGYASLNLTWDSRNSSTFPTEGGLHETGVGYHQDLRGGPFNAVRAGADLRHYFAVNEDHVFAVRACAAFGFERAGELPFTMMTTIGGENKLRGIIDPRFRDRSAFFTLAEYRLKISGRWGANLFGGFGQVAPSLLQFQWDRFQPSAGVGIRYSVVDEERVNIRLDVATSATGSFETYIAAGEAF